MHPQLADQLQQLQAVTDRVTAFAASMSDAAFQQRPPSGGWCAAECIAHLNLTTVEYLPIFDTTLAAAPAGFPETRRYKRGFLGGLLAWTLEPPARMRGRTLPRFVPGSIAPKAAVVAEFVRLQREVEQRIRRADGRDLHVPRIVSPFNAKLSYNLYAAICILLAHERRHLWQAERAARG
jgi:hypothetical protein